MLRRAAARCTAVLRAAAADSSKRRSTTSFSDAAASAAAQYVPDRTSFTRRRAILFALGAPLTALPVLAAIDDGVARSVYFNFYALPALAHYRLVEWLHKNASEEELDKALLPLHERYAPVSLAVIRRLKGMYVKLGQMGATRSDFVHKAYIERCETLQDSCPYEPLSYVEELLERSLGRPVREVFRHIDPVPLGAASIGQVHRAVLLDGRQVAVKVQYPRVEALFRGDLRTIRRFAAMAQPEHLTVLDEVERAFLTEFDFQREADALQQVADAVERSPLSRAVTVPRPLRELCRKDVLVMEYLPGIKLVDALRERATALAASRGMTLAQLRDEWAASSAAAGTGTGGLPTAPRAASPLHRAAMRAALAASDAAHNAPLRLRNLAARAFGKQLAPLRSTPPPVDIESVLALLAAVHARQLFVDGLFNGDCHPGNVLMLPDGRLGLIDYGQAKRMTLQERAKLARLILALADGRREDAVRLFRACGYVTQHSDDDLAFRAAVIAFDRDDREITGGINVQAWFELQARLDPCLHWPEEYVMASRNTLLLRGMGIVLGRPISVAQAWRPTAEAFLKAHKEPLR